ncbi:MAG TPA: hypothetical protein VH437_19010 [Terriglobales bacterium]|jgi:hypothetical protein
MYTGTLIEQLMEVVERAEEQTRVNATELERWYAGASYQGTSAETKLIGVA